MADVMTRAQYPGTAFAPHGTSVQRWRPRAEPGWSPAQWLAFLVFHIPLAMLLKASPLLATAHAFFTFAVALALVSRTRAPQRILPILGYIVTCESLWRTSHAVIFYESSKYALAGLSLLALTRFRWLRHADKTPLVYFICFLPSLMVMPEFDREDVSFNLSGPFALAVTTLLMSRLRVSRSDLKRLFLAMLGPVVGLATVATFSTVTADSINFYQSKIASGGLGQNQAASLFGLGALLAFLYLYLERRPSLRGIVLMIGLWCAGQGFLTFSRGGIATALAAALAAGFYLLRDRRSRAMLVVRGLMISALIGYLMIPMLDTFTEGALSDRYTSTHLTGRDKLIEADLIAFRENPLFGVGPGQSEKYHVLTFKYAAAHTEYSRMLAEHGSFGILAMVLLGWMSLCRWRRSHSLLDKALKAAFTVWALLFMFHAAMRMAAVAFTFALGACAFRMEEARPVRQAVPLQRRQPRPPALRPRAARPTASSS